MKRFLLLLSLVLISANLAFGQAAKKKSAPAPKAAKKTVVEKPAAKATGTAPKLETKDPSFIGFTGSFVSFGKISGDNRSFTMKVEYKPWFFEVSGVANAGYNTPDLGEDVIVVLAYYNAPGQAADGANYQAGFFDLMMYLDDEPIKISNLNFTLTSKATAGSAVLVQAKTWNFEQGKVFKMQKYNTAIIKAQAAALDKSDIAKEEAAAKKRVTDSIAKEEKRVSDSIARVEKKRKDSIAAHKKYVKDSIEAEKAEQNRKKAAAKKKKRVVIEEDEEEDEEDEPPPPPKKKKKRPVVEEEDDFEDDEPPVRKKAPPKKKKFEVVDEDEEEAPPPKKKPAKKR